MASFGKCPKCEKTPLHVDIEPIDVKRQSQRGGPTWFGTSYLCPHCKTILSVGIDPMVLKMDLVQEICDILGLKPKKRL